jgi:hypothetical protein
MQAFVHELAEPDVSPICDLSLSQPSSQAGRVNCVPRPSFDLVSPCFYCQTLVASALEYV